jgi:hypothetical protein
MSHQSSLFSYFQLPENMIIFCYEKGGQAVALFAFTCLKMGTCLSSKHSFTSCDRPCAPYLSSQNIVPMRYIWLMLRTCEILKYLTFGGLETLKHF